MHSLASSRYRPNGTTKVVNFTRSKFVQNIINHYVHRYILEESDSWLFRDDSNRSSLEFLHEDELEAFNNKPMAEVHVARTISSAD